MTCTSSDLVQGIACIERHAFEVRRFNLAALPFCVILFTFMELIEGCPSHGTQKEEYVKGLPHYLTPKPTLIRHEYLVTCSITPPPNTHKLS